MLTIYGTHLCPDCEHAEATLKKLGIPYAYLDIAASTANMKAFLALRDTLDIFAPVRERHGIGVPCFALDGGAYTLGLDDVVSKS
jgi:glutaredoxin-related protein